MKQFFKILALLLPCKGDASSLFMSQPKERRVFQVSIEVPLNKNFFRKN